MNLLLHKFGIDEPSGILYVNNLVDGNLAQRHIHRNICKAAANGNGIGVYIDGGAPIELIIVFHVVICLKGKFVQITNLIANRIKDCMIM